MWNTFSIHSIGRTRNVCGDTTQAPGCCVACQEIWERAGAENGPLRDTALAAGLRVPASAVWQSHNPCSLVSSAGPSRDLGVTLPPLEVCSSLSLLRNEAGGVGLLGWRGGEGGTPMNQAAPCVLAPLGRGPLGDPLWTVLGPPKAGRCQVS